MNNGFRFRPGILQELERIRQEMIQSERTQGRHIIFVQGKKIVLDGEVFQEISERYLFFKIISRGKNARRWLAFSDRGRMIYVHKKVLGEDWIEGYSPVFLNGNDCDYRRENLKMVSYNRKNGRKYETARALKNSTAPFKVQENGDCTICKTRGRLKQVCFTVCSKFFYDDYYRNCLSKVARLNWAAWKPINCPVKRNLDAKAKASKARSR